MDKNNLNLPVGYLLERTTRVVKLRFHRLFKELEIDLTPEQWVVLDLIHTNTSMSQKELVEQSFKDAPAISRVIKGLVKKEWISISSNSKDKRVQNIALSKEGKMLVKSLLPQIAEIRKQGLKGISNSDYEQFKGLIDRIFSNYVPTTLGNLQKKK